MKLDTSHLEIKIDTKQGRAYFTVEDFKDAQLQYELHTDKGTPVLETKSTFVPNALRGKGLASQLAHEVMSFAQKNNYQVKPTCSFVADYLNKHPEFQHLQA